MFSSFLYLMNFWTLRSTGHLDDLLFQGVFCSSFNSFRQCAVWFLSCAQHVFGSEYRGESFSVEVRSRIFLATFLFFVPRKKSGEVVLKGSLGRGVPTGSLQTLTPFQKKKTLILFSCFKRPCLVTNFLNYDRDVRTKLLAPHWF